MYAQQVGRSGRNGAVAVCLLFLNPADLGPLQRAAERAAASLADLQAGSSVVVQALSTSAGAMIDGNAFVGRGVQLQRVEAVLDVLVLASFVAVDQSEHAYCSARRGPFWHCPPHALSAVAAYFFYAVLRPSFNPGSTFARFDIADVAGSDHFAQLGVGATRATVRAVDELAASGILMRPVEWRGHLFTVARLRAEPPTAAQLAQAWAKKARRQQRAAQSLEEVADFLGATSCLYTRLCFLFGGDDETPVARGHCRCYICRPACPSFE